MNKTKAIKVLLSIYKSSNEEEKKLATKNKPLKSFAEFPARCAK